jgi:hypothetical protein
VKLTSSETQSIAHDLRVAADRYEENAAALTGTAHQRMADQFTLQAANSRAMADRIENSEAEL